MNLPVDPGIRLRQDYLAGMPHLAYVGLSENWLLKECGHLHWLMLARLKSFSVPAFSDREGRSAYAAFTAINLRGLQLERIVENTRFELHSRLQPAGRARHCSEHLLLAAGLPCGELTMLSTFVCRTRAGDNRSATRAQFAINEGTPVEPGQTARALLEAGKHWLEAEPVEQVWEQRFSPCPALDFNGAEFLYFAQFQATVERAEWALARSNRQLPCRERQLYFYGNLNPGDDLLLRLAPPVNVDGMQRCEIRRASDGRKLAEVLTRRALQVPA
ncbi:putative biosynthetic protein [compost metagenome]